MTRISLLPGPDPPTTARTTNVPARTNPAEVTVGPVAPTERTTARRKVSFRASSLMRVMTQTL